MEVRKAKKIKIGLRSWDTVRGRVGTSRGVGTSKVGTRRGVGRRIKVGRKSRESLKNGIGIGGGV